jgi:hypothetical protein
VARTWPIIPLVIFSCAAKRPAPPPPPPPVGWYAEGAGECYAPPKWDGLGTIDRRLARDAALQAMIDQWKGGHGSGLSIDETKVEDLETILLREPEKTEGVVAENLERCKAAMKGGGADAWTAWFDGLPSRLLAGVCTRPLDTTMFFYLEVEAGWQFQAPICPDDKIRVTVSAEDYYRVDDKGPWINANGDTSKRPFGDQYPCTTEDCHPGQVILRFRGDSGHTIIQGVGTSLIFQPPEAGTVEIMINDTTFFNNAWKVEQGLQHRATVTYTPVED